MNKEKGLLKEQKKRQRKLNKKKGKMIKDLRNIKVIIKKIVHFQQGILNKTGELKEHVYFGTLCHLENNIDSWFQLLRYDNYIIFYRVTKETILFIRKLHCLQDYFKQLF